jgi:hypothetical protein
MGTGSAIRDPQGRADLRLARHTFRCPRRAGRQQNDSTSSRHPGPRTTVASTNPRCIDHGDSLVRRTHAIREFVVTDHHSDPVGAQRGRQRFGPKLRVEQHYVGSDHCHREGSLHETSPIAAQDSDRMPRSDAAAVELIGE